MAYPAWTKDEDDILRNVYPNESVRGTIEALSKAGHTRTVGAVKMRANLLGVRVNPHRKLKKQIKRSDRRYGSSDKRTLINICLNDELDEDVIRALRSKPNRSQYIRDLVRRDIGRR